MKKLIVCLFAISQAIILLTSGISVNAVTLDSDCDLTYIVDENNNALITGGMPNSTGELDIPSSIDGYSVIGINTDAFLANDSIKYLIIADGVENIRKNAFMYCSNLEYISFPTTLKSIDEYAFSDCVKNKSIYIQSDLDFIGMCAFKNNSELRTLFIDNDSIIDDFSLNESSIFYGCNFLYDITLPTNTTSIGYNVFKNCDSINSVRYYGTSDEYCSITVDTGNESLLDAITYCEFNKPIEVVSNEFNTFKETFNFSNKEISEKYGTYSLDEEYYNLLKSKLNPCEMDAVDELLGTDTDGYCYGIAVLAKLIHDGYINPSDLTEGAKYTKQINPDNSLFKNVLNYYMVLQAVDIMDNKMLHDTYSIDQEGINSLVSIVESGEVAVTSFSIIAYNTDSSLSDYNFAIIGAHAVLAYGLEYGDWVVNGTPYNGKILIYDSNTPRISDTYHLYFNDNGEYTIKGYTADIPESYDIPYEKSGVLLTSIINSDDLLNYKGYYENLVSFDNNLKHKNLIKDINNDGVMNVLDLVLLNKYLHGKEVLSEKAFEIADLNSDNLVNIYDYILMKRILLQL